jgi:Protein of unknown function (DUF2500).
MRNKIAIGCIAIVLIIMLIAFINPIEAPIEYIIATLVIGVIIIFALIQGIMINRLPELTTKAKVTVKNVVKEKINGADPSQDTENTYCKVTFETENNFQWTFNLSLKFFNSVVEGDTGTLVYKESKRQKIFFVSFKRQT